MTAPATTTKPKRAPAKPKAEGAKAPPRARSNSTAETKRVEAKGVRHTLTLEQEPNCWKITHTKAGVFPPTRVIGWFSTEATINQKLEAYGDSRRLRSGKLVEEAA